jgi:hypothetical protein
MAPSCAHMRKMVPTPMTAWREGGLRQSHLCQTHRLRGSDESLIERQEGIAGCCPPQVERIGEIHAVIHTIQRKRDQLGILKHDIGKPAETPERLAHAFGIKTIRTAQHPFGFQHHRRADEHLLAVDNGLGFRRLLGWSPVR